MKTTITKLYVVRLLLALWLVIAPLAAPHAMPAASPLWGDLQPGKYAVGFKTLFAGDLARPVLPVPEGEDGEKGNAEGRQMLIGVWYPTNIRRGARMRLAEYAHLLEQELNFTPLNAARKEQARLKFIEAAVELGGLANELRAKLESLLTLETAAFRNAPPAAGRFPLVIFPDAPVKLSILCEYLASHGFVVAATSLKGTYEAELEFTVTGLETIAADLQFVINHVRAWQVRARPIVDREKLALIGLVQLG